MLNKIVVVGGAGFIGSHFAKMVVENKLSRNVEIFDNFTSGTVGHIQKLQLENQVTITRGDLKELEQITSALEGADLVAHFAANPDIAKAASDPTIDFWEGTFLTQNLLEGMRVNGVEKIIYSSGSGVYGDKPGVYLSESESELAPISTYGASKLASEALISAYSHMFGIRGRAFRFANVVGPRQTHGVGFDFVNRLKSNGRELHILGDGTQTKSYIYVDDVISAMRAAFDELQDQDTKAFDVYNAATGDYISVNEIALEACNLLELKNVEFVYSGGDRGWKGDVPTVKFNTEKLLRTGWKPKFSSMQAMRKSMQSMITEN